MARFRKHHKKRHVFGKKKERAIRAIAMGPVETKKFYRDTVTLAPDPTNNSFGSLFNIFDILPKGDTNDSENTVIGNKFNCRGVKFWVNSQNVADTEVVYRLTVFSCNNFYGTGGPSINTGIQILANNPDFYETEVVMPQVHNRYNTQRLNVLKSKTWSLKKSFSGQAGEDSWITMWVPITGIKTSEKEEGTAGGTTVGELKGKNYYFLLEVHYTTFAVTPVPWQNTAVNVAYCIYFKDP